MLFLLDVPRLTHLLPLCYVAESRTFPAQQRLLLGSNYLDCPKDLQCGSMGGNDTMLSHRAVGVWWAEW